jgi:NifB/MoaA-like Fe-S oxidoreductase|tara:strand:+ start:480 stop:674 length:195 start_codon:yes stop_codon:yes gene_type:complete
MGHYEDFFWEVTEELNQLGLRKEFDIKIKEMRYDDDWKHKELKPRWEYALKFVKENNTKVKIKR